MKPQHYSRMNLHERRMLRGRYANYQKGLCWYCKSDLHDQPPKHITDKPLNMNLFPVNFLKYPIHLHHDHETDLTIGAVHAYCNGVLWQYEGQ